MIPQVLATFRHLRREGAWSGVRPLRAILGFASAFGLVLGGLLTQADLFGWSWRTVFLINVPIALVSLAAGARLVPETRDRSAGRPDVIGAALLTAALVAIAYPLLEGRSLGWPVWIWLVSQSVWPSSWRSGSWRSDASTHESRRSFGRGCSTSQRSAPG
jgi:MFS family permease